MSSICKLKEYFFTKLEHWKFLKAVMEWHASHLSIYVVVRYCTCPFCMNIPLLSNLFLFLKKIFINLIVASFYAFLCMNVHPYCITSKNLKLLVLILSMF